MNITINHFVNQARKAIFQAYKYSSPVVGKLSSPLAFKLFDSQILPILEYGCEILVQGSEIDKFDKFHLNFMKHLRQQTPTETGRFPLFIRQQLRTVKYWLYLLTLPKTSILKQAYNMRFKLDQIGRHNWCSKVRELLFSLGKGIDWLSQQIHNTSLMLKFFCMILFPLNVYRKNSCL